MLSIILGPMFSGKTTKIQYELNRYSDCSYKCLYINSARDNRTSTMLSTHSEVESKNDGFVESVTKIKVKILNDVYKSNLHLYSFDVIGIDEAQFFPDLLSFVLTLTDELNKIVIVGALDGTYERKVFPDSQVFTLIPLANSVEKLQALCADCNRQVRHKREAPFSWRISDDTGDIVIGGHDKYIPICRTHYNMRLKMAQNAVSNVINVSNVSKNSNVGK